MQTSDPSPDTRRVWPIIVATALYVLVSIPAALIRGNGEFIFYILVMLVLGAGVYAFDRRIRFPAALLWCLSAWGALHMAGGLVPVPESWSINGDQRVLYSWWLIPNYLKYDHVVHAFGFGVTTWACWRGLRTIAGHARPSFGALTLCVMGGMGFGALNEVVEFVATLIMPSTNVGGYTNTGWDLVSNFVGSVIAVIAIGVVSSRTY
ncbi:MAG: DUF2238 domain-containing protein [Phycisphaera sp.]|nr:DUF2238 domain-containing protein [Phycisphaera sp.]